MSSIDGVSTKPTSPWEDDYEKPLPLAAQKAAVNIANAPWLASPAAPSFEPAHPPAIFSNPAMLGPPVALAKAPPPPAPKPADLAAALDALHGVTLRNLAENIPAGTRTDSTRAFTCGAGYKLYPEVKKQPDGKDAVVYWTAYNTETKRVEFLVGPDALRAFTSAPSDFANAAANGFMGDGDAVTHESVRAVDVAMRKGIGAGIGQAWHASGVAWRDPEWVLKTVTNVGSTFVGSVEAADRLQLAARTRAAEQAAGTPGTAFVEHVNADLPLGKTDGKRTTNCANTAIATDASIAGSPASALPGNLSSPKVLQDHFGTTWSGVMSDTSGIESAIKAAGPGSRGIVFGISDDAPVGHFFNVVNDAGAIRFVDGQVGGAAALAPYSRFYLLRTN